MLHTFIAVILVAQQPVTVTSSSDFQKGNQEGLVVTTQDRVTRAPISAGTLAGWSGSGSLPFGRIAPAVVHGARVYLVAGSPDGFSAMDQVVSAPLNSDGTVGSWGITSPVANARAGHGAAAYNGFVYAIGGTTDFTDSMSSVEFAPINANGTLGDWAGTTPLPSARHYLSCFAYNGFIYAVGGLDTDEVLYAPVRADGTIGDWTPTTSLPAGRTYHSTVAYGGHVYVIGGQLNDLSDPYDDSLAAPINADGTIGDWTSTSGLSVERRWASCAALDGFVYAIGGYGPTGAMIDVDAASINPDGTLGSWSAVASIDSGRLFPTAFASNGFLYALGGFNDSFDLPAEVLVTAVDTAGNQDPERLRGEYSILLDLGADTPTRSVVFDGEIAQGGVIRVQVRVAPEATGDFGAETVIDGATPGQPVQIEGTGRHVWIRFTLDDTGAAAQEQPSRIAEVTVTPFAPPAAGTVSDGSGSDIDTQASTSVIQANWSGFTASPGDPIASYEWAIGTSPGATNLQFWTNVGLATSATNSSLSLTSGTKFVSVRAISASGLKSATVTSDGVQVLASTAAPSGDDDSGSRRCSTSAAPGSGSVAALFAGLALLGLARRDRRARR